MCRRVIVMACWVLLLATLSPAQTTATPTTSAPAPRPPSTIQAGKAASKKMDTGPGWFEFLFWSPLSGWIVGLAGIAATIMFALRARQTKKPSVSCRNFTLLGDKAKDLEKLKVFYGNEPVSNLTVSVIDFWNAGTATIDTNDIAPKDPLMFRIVDGQLLDVSPKVRQDYEASNLAVGQSFDIENAILLTFDFIDPGKGGSFELFHTSTASKPVLVTGTIKGAGCPKWRAERATKKPLAEQYGPLLYGLAGLTAICAIFPITVSRKDDPTAIPMAWTMAILCLISLIARGLMTWVDRRVRARTEAAAAERKHAAEESL